MRSEWAIECVCPPGQPVNPEAKNYKEIERLERLLSDLRAEKSTARETEAIREIGLEIALAVREVGAMLTDVGWEQTYPTAPRQRTSGPAGQKED